MGSKFFPFRVDPFQKGIYTQECTQKVTKVVSLIEKRWPIYLKHILVWIPPKGQLANRADPEKMPQNAASDQGLHCLHQIQ